MSYRLCVGAPKPRAALVENEGLTDILLIVSVLGHPGGLGPLSLAPVQLGPDGPEAFSPALLAQVAVVLLSMVEEMGGLPADIQDAVRLALVELRRPF